LSIDIRSRSFVAILIALTMASPVALTMYVPVMPTIANAFDSSFETIQWSLTVYLVAVAAGQLIYGPLSDVFGRLVVLKAGMAMYFLSSLALVVIPSIPMLIGGRAFQAFGACSGMVIARAMIRDTYGKHETAVILAYVSMGFAVGPAVAPFLGGMLDVHYGWHSIFIALAMYAGLLVLVTWFIVPETLIKRVSFKGAGQFFGGYTRLIGDRMFLTLALTSACLSAGFFGYIGGAAFLFVDELGLGPQVFGLSVMALAVCFILGNFLATRLVKKLEKEIIIGIGIALLTGCGVLWAAFYIDGTITVYRVIMPTLLFGLARGMCEPFIIATCLNLHSNITGTTAGFLGFVQLLISGLFTILVPMVMNIEPRYFFLIIGLVAFASAGFYGISRLFASRNQ
jgi:DHA1 family bicyclomycin/chloramphenicol resistance-like MFS transporter